MPARKMVLSIVAVLAMPLPAYAQGGGSGAGAASSAAGSGGTASGNPAADQHSQKTNKVEQNERNAAVSGTNTRPSSPGSGTVSAPNVGVGHSANGVPIGMPGSGLGSPGHSQGPTK
jgi:hypothetical protein